MADNRPLWVRVAEVIDETADARSLVLEPAAGDLDRFSYRPGQFLTLRVPDAEGGDGARCYSLSSSPHRDEPLKVTVKRTGHGSNWVCDTVRPGHTLQVLGPSGTFTPASLDSDLLLLAGGSGITPVISILKSALHAGRGRVALLYANRDERSVIFRDELIALSHDHPDRLQITHWLESVQGQPRQAGLRGALRPHAEREVYLCGPTPFMRTAVDALATLDVPRRRIRQERFTSLSGDPFAPASGEPRGAAPEARGMAAGAPESGTDPFPYPASPRQLPQQVTRQAPRQFPQQAAQQAALERSEGERGAGESEEPRTVETGEAAESTETGVAAEALVYLDGHSTTVTWPPGTRLLDALLDSGLDAPFSCREGACSACACRLLEGEVAMCHNGVLEREDLEEGYILACQATARTPRVTLTYDE